MTHYTVISKSALTGEPVIICITPIKQIADCVCVLINNDKSETIAEVQEHQSNIEQNVQQS